MSPSARSVSFSTANPHALATILEASETRSIIASRDIFDVSGIKLWARDLPVSQALQRKLLDRQLRHPLESCLVAEDGVSGRSLVQSVEELVERDTPLAALLQPHAEKIVHAAEHLPLHSVAQLLLTAGQASRPGSFEHAVQAMALAGALMSAHGGGTRDMRLAMLAGLLHDLGEMYLAPQYGEADADRTLDFQSYQQLVVHPHVGKLLIEQLTNYPPEVARAISEHHERLDGSGYPHCLHRDLVSPLGRLLAVSEATLAALRGDSPHLTRASVALRVVPGEFDFGWVGLVSLGARGQKALQATLGVDELQARLEAGRCLAGGPPPRRLVDAGCRVAGAEGRAGTGAAPARSAARRLECQRPVERSNHRRAGRGGSAGDRGRAAAAPARHPACGAVARGRTA